MSNEHDMTRLVQRFTDDLTVALQAALDQLPEAYDGRSPLEIKAINQRALQVVLTHVQKGLQQFAAEGGSDGMPWAPKGRE